MNTDETIATLKAIDSVLENMRLPCVYASSGFENMEKIDSCFDDEDWIQAVVNALR